MNTVHIIGVGLSGLAAALALKDAELRIHLYEAAGQAGGRCRSYFDHQLGCELDNGNHILIHANRTARAFLQQIGAAAHWRAQPYRFWDVPYTWRQLHAMLARSALNTPLSAVSKRLWIRTVVAALAGGITPLVPQVSLQRAIIDPALRALQGHAEIRYHYALKSLERTDGCLTALRFDGDTVTLDAGDMVILATSPAVTASLLPELAVPDVFEPIVNLHFRYDLPARTGEMLGLPGGAADWVFVKDGVLSTTSSAARSAEPEAVWRDVCQALRLGELPMPPYRQLIEKRATFRASPDQLAKRPGSHTPWANLLLAGDYTATGLPATIEGAIRSGQQAAKIIRSGL